MSRHHDFPPGSVTEKTVPAAFDPRLIQRLRFQFQNFPLAVFCLELPKGMGEGGVYLARWVILGQLPCQSLGAFFGSKWPQMI